MPRAARRACPQVACNSKSQAVGEGQLGGARRGARTVAKAQTDEEALTIQSCPAWHACASAVVAMLILATTIGACKQRAIWAGAASIALAQPIATFAMAGALVRAGWHGTIEPSVAGLCATMGTQGIRKR